jgi:hypothetical protein
MPAPSYLVDTNILLRLVPRKEDWSRVVFARVPCYAQSYADHCAASR